MTFVPSYFLLEIMSIFNPVLNNNISADDSSRYIFMPIGLSLRYFFLGKKSRESSVTGQEGKDISITSQKC